MKDLKIFLPALIVIVVITMSANTTEVASKAPDLINTSSVNEKQGEKETDEKTEKETTKETKKTTKKPAKKPTNDDEQPAAVNHDNTDSSAYNDGTYYGIGKGFNGNITVKVTVASKKIGSIEITDHIDDLAYLNNARSVIPAIIAKQSTNVDAISGATYSSNGIILATRDALKKSVENKANEAPAKTTPKPTTTPSAVGRDDTDSSKYNDGTYYGVGKGFNGNVTTKVTVAAKKIKKIEITDHVDDKEYLDKAKKAIIPAIIKKQSTNIDVVSGATYSSNGIILAVRDALKKSVKNKPNEEPPKTTPQPTPTPPAKLPDDGLSGKKYADGTYSASARGYNGDILVEVKIENGEIKSIEIISHNDDKEYFDMAIKLIQDIVAKKSTNVDVVSGATFTSNGIIKAVRAALNQAVLDESDIEDDNKDEGNKDDEGDVPPLPENTYKDGSYDGFARGYSGYTDITVIIENGKISEIKIISHEDDEPYFLMCLGLLDRVINRQRVEGIDVVSGATFSSQGILGAIDNALSKATNN